MSEITTQQYSSLQCTYYAQDIDHPQRRMLNDVLSTGTHLMAPPDVHEVASDWGEPALQGAIPEGRCVAAGPEGQ